MPPEHAIVVSDELRLGGYGRRRGGERAGLEVGKGVEHGGGEHVAGDPADGIELDVHDAAMAPVRCGCR